MPQIFHPSMNTFSRVSIFGAVFFVVGLFWLLAVIVRSPYVTEAGVIQVQPVPFSHKHHVGDAGIDCRYCHTSVEDSSFAGIPATEVCMNCHSHLWADSPMLAPVHESYRTGRPLRWTRVHDLPDFAYFDHSLHVHKGIGCVTCHGQVDEMPLMWREETLHMEWCLDCHRQPEKYVRPREHIFTMDPQPLRDREELARKLAEMLNEDPADRLDGMEIDELRATLAQRLVEVHRIQKKTNCSVCHR